MVFYKGENRYPFGVFTKDRTQVPDAQVALYFAKVPPTIEGDRRRPRKPGQVQPKPPNPLDQPAVGPFPASIESLATQPAFRAKTTADDPDAASVVYATNVDFPSDGEWRIVARRSSRGTS